MVDVLTREVEAGHGAATDPRLVGRDAELALVADVLATTARGTAQVVLIEGEPGIGKTRLLDELLAVAHDEGFATFRAGGEELGWGRPFATLASALAVVPNVRHRVMDEFLDVLEAVTRRGPVLVALDDLQWVERSTLAILPSLLRRLAGQPLLLVGAFRGDHVAELDKAIDALLAQGAKHLVLAPLSDDSMLDLVAMVVRMPPGPVLRQLVAGAGGNPWMAIDLVNALRAEDAIEHGDSHADTRCDALPVPFRAGVSRRLRRLPETTVDALRMASVLGTPFSFQGLCDVLDVHPSHLMPVLDRALHAGLIGVDADHLVFRHALVREAIYEELPPAFRQALHRQVGAAFAAAGRPAADVARHVALGATKGDNSAIAWLHTAARDAATRAPLEAADLLERALELCTSGDRANGPIAADLVDALSWAGRAADAQVRAEEALTWPLDPETTMALHRGLAIAALMQGNPRRCLAEVEAASTDPDAAESVRPGMLADGAMASMLVGDLDRAAALAGEAARLAETLHDWEALTTALCTLSWVANLRGDYAASIDLAVEAVRITPASGDDEVSRRHPQFFLGIVLLTADRWDEGVRHLRSGRRRGEAVGTFWDLPLYHWAFALLHLLTGDWDDLDAELDAGLAHCEETGLRLGIVWAHAFRALAAVHRGRLDVAEAALAVVDQEISACGPQFGADWGMWARALLLEARGNPADALTMLSATWQLETDMGIVSELHMLGPDLVRLAIAAGDRDLAESATVDVEVASARAGVASFQSAALRCRGLLDRDPDALLDAVSMLRDLPRRVELAATCEEAAEVLREQNRVTEAVQLLEESSAIFECIGAERAAARVEAKLRSGGVRRGRRGARRRPTTGWPSLTRTEQNVVRLAREGLTNREIGERLYVSRRTVETHLSHVFTKLGLASRRQLMLTSIPLSA